MSLDVYLKLEGAPLPETAVAIPIREDGQVKMITREEWDERYPGKEPYVPDIENTRVYWANITHNLNAMADEAGLYEACWAPEELGAEIAADIIKPLEKGLVLLKSDPVRFQKFNPANGWGDYHGFVRWVKDYLDACRRYPQATIRVSR